MHRLTGWRRAAAIAWLVLCVAAANGEPVGAAPCAGDCDENGAVAVTDLVTCVGSALTGMVPGDCGACDANADGTVRVEELVAAIGSALNGCATVPSPTPTPTPASPATGGPAPTRSATPTPRMGLGCGGAEEKPCIGRGAGAPVPTCVADETVLVGEITRTTEGGSDRVPAIMCGSKGGGVGAPERVYEFVAPFAGRFEITALSLGQAFLHLLHARRDSCGGEFLDCTSGSPLKPAVITVPKAPGEQLAAGERIAIVVDGNGEVPGSSPKRPQQGPFSLAIRPLLPDLEVTAVVGPAVATAGEVVAVSARVRNRGDQPAGPFRVDFTYARDAQLTQRLGTAGACQIGGLAPGAAAECSSPTGLTVPRVAPGPYFIGAVADSLSVVLEQGDGPAGNGPNNTAARATSIRALGARLEQELFRAVDGTIYQLVRVVPSDQPSAAERWRVVGVAGSLSSASATASSETQQVQQGLFVSYSLEVSSGGLPTVGPIRRTAVLRPNDGSQVSFQPGGRGRLILGVGSDALQVCRDGATCTGAVVNPIVPVAIPQAGLPAACTTPAQALAFGLAALGDPSCSKPTNGAMACAPEPRDGFSLLPGEAAVFVYDTDALASFRGAVGAFGINDDTSDGCARDRIVDVAGLTGAAGAVPSLVSFVEHVTDGRSGLRRVVASPDGQHLYVVAALGGALLAYQRDPLTGTLTLIQTVRGGSGGVHGLAGVDAVALSNDGAHLYATSPIEGALAVFARSPSSGLLTFSGALRDGRNGVAGLAGARAVAVSPDGNHVYVGGRSRDVHDVTLAVFTRQPGSGALTFAALTSRIPVPLDTPDLRELALAMSADGLFLYAASDDLRQMVVFRRDRAGGTLVEIERLRAGDALALSPDGGHVYTADSEDGVLTVFRRDAETGRLLAVQELSDVNGQALVTPRSVVVSPDGTRLYVVTPGVVFDFARNPDDGTVEPTGAVEAVDGLAQARAAAAVAGGARGYLYVASEAPDDALVTLERANPAAALVHRATDRPASARVEALAGARVVAVAPDGGDVFVGSAEGLMTFARDPESGRLGLAQDLSSVGPASALAVSPDGRYLYANAGGVTVFARNAETHQLAIVQQDSSFPGFRMSLSGDGATLFGASGGQLGARLRDAGSGLLSAPSSVNVGPSIAALAATSSQSVALIISTFQTFPGGQLRFVSRNPQTGALTDAGGFTYQPESVLANISSLIVGPGGGLYATAPEPPSGIPNGVRRIGGPAPVFITNDALVGARHAAFSPDERLLFVVSSTTTPPRPNQLLATVDATTLTGPVTPLDVQLDDTGRVDGLRGATAVAVSVDGRHVYVAGSQDNAVAAFALNRPAALPTPTPTATATGATPTRTRTGTATPTVTGTLPTATPTPTITASPTRSATVPAPPANDECLTAITGTFGAVVDTSSATSNRSDPVPGCGNGSTRRSVWFRLDGSLFIDTRGSDYDTIVSVYTGTCGNLTPLPPSSAPACNDDEHPLVRSSRVAGGGSGYYVMVSAYGTAGGRLQLNTRSSVAVAN